MARIVSFVNNLISRYHLAWQFFKFCLVGLTNLAIYLAIYYLITRVGHLHYIYGSIGGFLVAVTWSFVINLNWTFKHKTGDRRQQYVKFIIANLIGMGINLLLLSFFIEIIGLYDLAAQLVCTVFVAFINFGLNRFWTFRK